MASGCTHTEARLRAGLLDVESYVVELDLSSAGGALVRTEARFVCRQPGATTFADVSAAEIRSAVLNGRDLEPGDSWDGARLVLHDLQEVNMLVVDTVVDYSLDGRGLARMANNGEGETFVMAYCYPTYAPHVFCCFDQADLSADLTLTVVGPAGWTCVSNAALAERAVEGEVARWRFAVAPSVKPFELVMCAGPYELVHEARFDGMWGAVPLRVSCRRTLAGVAELGRAAEVVARALAYYENLLGLPCPTTEYDIVFAPGIAPLAAQMPGMMLVNESLFHRVANAEDDFVTMVLAHEAAHVWFGGMVEGTWWDDLWLAEAIATYLSYTAGSETLGMVSPWVDFAMDGKAAAFRADTLPTAQPVASSVSSAAEALLRPASLTYSKGASVIRQLEALIGREALVSGLRDYLTSFAGGTAKLDDIVECWSRAAERELEDWAADWLRQPGINTLRPAITMLPGGTIDRLYIVQGAIQVEPGPGLSSHSPVTPLRTHRVSVGLYDATETGLSRRTALPVEISGRLTAVPEANGLPAPAAVVVDEGDLTFALIEMDARSFDTLSAFAMDVGDPATEAVCWNASWQLTVSAQLSASAFVGLVGRRITSGRAPVAAAALMSRAIRAADYYAPSADRSSLRMSLATCALGALEGVEAGNRLRQELAAGYAGSAESDDQLALLREWLSGNELPGDLTLNLDLHRRILAALAARDLATDEDLEQFVRLDGASGDLHAVTCRAMRPDSAAKSAAWDLSLSIGQSAQTALAAASGICVPGQETLVLPWRERYFNEALSLVERRDNRTATRLARLLYPATLADAETIVATDQALATRRCSPRLQMVLVEQRAILAEIMAARSVPQPAATIVAVD